MALPTYQWTWWYPRYEAKSEEEVAEETGEPGGEIAAGAIQSKSNDTKSSYMQVELDLSSGREKSAIVCLLILIRAVRGCLYLPSFLGALLCFPSKTEIL